MSSPFGKAPRRPRGDRPQVQAPRGAQPSRAALIGRALLFPKARSPRSPWERRLESRCAALRARRQAGPSGRERPSLVGGHGRGGTPGPMPNPEVKPPSADGTAERVRGRAGRRRPARDVRGRRRALSRGARVFCIPAVSALQIPRYSINCVNWVLFGGSCGLTSRQIASQQCTQMPRNGPEGLF